MSLKASHKQCTPGFNFYEAIFRYFRNMRQGLRASVHNQEPSSPQKLSICQGIAQKQVWESGEKAIWFTKSEWNSTGECSCVSK